jgi:hypothetical protein
MWHTAAVYSVNVSRSVGYRQAVHGHTQLRLKSVDLGVKRSARTRSQRWSLAHSKEIRCDSKRESRLGWSTSIMKSPS